MEVSFPSFYLNCAVYAERCPAAGHCPCLAHCRLLFKGLELCLKLVDRVRDIHLRREKLLIRSLQRLPVRFKLAGKAQVSYIEVPCGQHKKRCAKGRREPQAPPEGYPVLRVLELAPPEAPDGAREPLVKEQGQGKHF